MPIHHFAAYCPDRCDELERFLYWMTETFPRIHPRMLWGGARDLAALWTARELGSPLPDRLRRALEAMSGFEMGDVRVCFDSPWPARVGARAFAYGTVIHLRPGAEDALAHEAWHVVQQKQGRVAQTRQVGGIAVNDDPALEREADRMGRAAERWSASRADGSCRPPVLRKGFAGQPIVQRAITVGTAAQTEAQALHELNVRFGMTNVTNPFLRDVITELSNAGSTFTLWNDLRLEAKRRTFGRRHLYAMDMLRNRELGKQYAYMEANDLDDVNIITGAYRGGRPDRLAYLYRVSGRPPFVMWFPKTDLQSAISNADMRRSEFYRWMTNDQAFRRAPSLMNCWEGVLYSGTWSPSRTRAPLYTRDYVFWSLQPARIPTQTFDGVTTTGRVPSFIRTIVNNPVYHTTCRDPTAVSGYPPIPANILAGMVIVFSCGAHVALAGGFERPIEDEGARAAYGRWGHAILELDGRSDGMRKGTIEDVFAWSPLGYAKEIHVGWLPENPAPTIVTLNDSTGTLLHQVNLPATDFYT